MLLRSSSTPLLGSLLSSYAESPNHNHHSDYSSPKHLPKKFSFHQTPPLHLITPSSSHSFNSSPSINAELTSEGSWSNGLRRVQSDGNLEGLASGSCNTLDEFNHSTMTKKFRRKPNCSVLQTIPSFAMHSNRTRYEEDDDEETDVEETDEEEDQRAKVESLENTIAFMNNYKGLENRNFMVELENEDMPSKMHLARGLGAFPGGFNGGGGGYNDYKPKGFGGEGNNGTSIEEYYQRMLEQNPGNPLFLRNYAQFLHQTKKDLSGAEEYYSRAILLDPGDGEILSQYAQLTWELHRDEERASSYFQRAVQAAPEDSHVLAAYASFLWEAEEEADNDMQSTKHLIHHESTVVVAAQT